MFFQFINKKQQNHRLILS